MNSTCLHLMMLDIDEEDVTQGNGNTEGNGSDNQSGYDLEG